MAIKLRFSSGTKLRFSPKHIIVLVFGLCMILLFMVMAGLMVTAAKAQQPNYIALPISVEAPTPGFHEMRRYTLC